MNGILNIPSLYMPKLYNARTGSDSASTTRIFPKPSLNPNRSDKYVIVAFHKNSVTENTRNNTLNKTPCTLAVRGGGSSTYRRDVTKNQMTVGISEYPQ